MVIRNVARVLALIGAFASLGFLVWAFSLHGTIGLFKVNGTFHGIFLTVLVYGILCLLVGIGLKFWPRPSSKRNKLAATIVILFSLPALIAPSGAFYYTSGLFSGGLGDTAPQLMLTDTTGTYGTPDLAITFTTTKASSNLLTWGFIGSSSPDVIRENKTSRDHVFVLSNLVPGEEYFYQINQEIRRTFFSPEIGTELHFAVGSDAHFGAVDADGEATIKMLTSIEQATDRFDAFFFLGDLVENGFSPTEWQEAMDTMSTISSSIPVSLAVGNHDTLFSGLKFYEQVGSPAGLEQQSGSQLWRRIDIGKIHFLILDVEWSAESITPAQTNWLEAQLQNIPSSEWKIVMCHGFFYSSGSFGNGWQWYDNQETVSKLAPLFEKYEVDLVFSGHNHQLELLQHNGVTYAICGAFGGASDLNRNYTSPVSLWYLNDESGFIDVKITGNSCSLTFRSANFDALSNFVIAK
ncbi:MAG: metallophosphoesterase family protein [Dehalogenimonas sp.]